MEELAEMTMENMALLQEKRHSLLILGDQCDFAELSSERLESDFEVRKGGNISMALDIIQNYSIDIVIVCMKTPGLDVKTFCQSIKRSRTMHYIGIIVISDTLALEHQIEFYNCDIDAFFIYPINHRLLIVMIGNLIRKGKIKSELINVRDSSCVRIPLMKHLACNNAFIATAAEIIGSNLNNPEFDFNQFAKGVKMSKSTLHRKLIEFTGLSPASFIVNVRLKHAHGLLLNTADNINNIARAVGYHDPKYFSKSFKSMFGKTPREYRRTYYQRGLEE